MVTIKSSAAGSPALYRYQWHLFNDGQAVIADSLPFAGIDLNVNELHHRGIRGKGVKIAVVDDGLQIQHVDLQANILQDKSHNFVTGTTDPSPLPFFGFISDAHGTAVAGIIAAKGWDNVGVRGVAPEALLSGFNVLASQNDPSKQTDRIYYAWGEGKEAQDVDIFNNSWGDANQDFPVVSEAEIQSWEKLMSSTRGGTGGIYIKSAGNSFITSNNMTEDSCILANKHGVGCVNSAIDPLQDLFNTTSVAAVNAKGIRSSYSSAGTNIWVSGLGGEYGLQQKYMPHMPEKYYDPAIVTTDLMGCEAGFNSRFVREGMKAMNALDNNESEIDGSCNYTACMNGTSAAAPTVSGVAALIVSEYPSLSWRDIKYILATTARKIDPQQPAVKIGDVVISPGWVTNAAGHAYSSWYGFGLVDAKAAVEKAQSFEPLPPVIDSGWVKTEGSKTIGAFTSPGRLTISLFSDIKKIEAVQLKFATTNQMPTFLMATLISPAGTKSYVLPPFSALQATPGGFEVSLIASNAFLDEPAQGDWIIELSAVADKDHPQAGELKQFSLRVIGH